MEYRKLGKSGLKVSTICLGAMMFGDQTDEATADRIVGMARDAGVNFIDTADVYTLGESERVTGRIIARDRDSWVLATKVGNPMGKGPNDRGLTRKWVVKEVDASLKRLGTDYIDVYYYHREDLDTPIAEMVSAAGEVIRAGKVRYIALSNFRSWRIAEFVNECRR